MIKLTTVKPRDFKGDLLVFFVRQQEKGAPIASDRLVQEEVDRAFAVGDCRGKKDEHLLIYPDERSDGFQARRILVLGLGQDELDRELFRGAGGTVAQKALELKASRIYMVLPQELDFADEEMAQALTEGSVLGSYQFNRHREVAADEKTEITRISIHAQGRAAVLRREISAGYIAARATATARDMANEPGNFWTPSSFVDFARGLADNPRVNVQVLGQKDLKRMKMGGLLGVSQGSDEPPAMVVVEYRTGGDVPTIMLVGKGLTFDSGGISLKPGAGMADMKYDMCGGAAVMAAMAAIVQEGADNLDVVAIVPASENMPGGGAVKPGDVITCYGGKTVEVDNTDAEGRLILADSLAWGKEKFKPAAIIDLATLTGAVIVGLGHHRTGILGTDDDLVDRVIAAGDQCGEPLWRLPLGREYSDQLKSKVADLKNVGGKSAGTITAAAFLQEFVGDTPWCHLDIAGTAWNFTKRSYVKEGPSGTGARTLLQLVRNWQS